MDGQGFHGDGVVFYRLRYGPRLIGGPRGSPNAESADAAKGRLETHQAAVAGRVSFDSPRSAPLGENQAGSILVVRITGRGSFVELGKGEQREVHFYQVNAATGQSAAYGSRSIHGVDLAVKHINEAGGFTDDCGNNYTVKVTLHDMANSREQAIAGIRKAADDPTVLAALGSTPSTGFVPMVPVAGQVKLPIIATGSAAPIAEWNPYAFRVTITTQAAAPQFMQTMKDELDIDQVAIIYDISQDAQRAEAELIRDLAAEIGYEMTAFEAFRAGDKDFRAQLTTIRGTNPKWVGIYAATPEGTAIINQMDEMGFLDEVNFFTGFGSFNDPKWWDLTEGRVNGGVNWAVGFDLESDDPAMKKVVADYASNFDDDITIYSLYGYQALQTAVDAVKRSCTATDREKFRDALATTKIDALAGPVSFDSPRSAPLGENQAGSILVVRITGRGSFVELGK